VCQDALTGALIMYNESPVIYAFSSKELSLKQLIIYSILILFLFIGLWGCTPAALKPKNDNILLIDDFSSNLNNWNVWENEAGSAVSYFQQGLVFIINIPQYDYISVPNGSFEDVRIEATANKLTGSDDNDYGIICRYQNEKNYYGFILSSDGFFGIIKVKEGIYQLLNNTSLEFNAMIHTGNEFNYLRMDCIGNTISAYVNNSKLAEVTDPDFSDGRVGLMAGSFSKPGIAILFDNFLVLKP
jgi:hypothetical protein